MPWRQMLIATLPQTGRIFGVRPALGSVHYKTSGASADPS
jgi:hypothetical protein